MVKAFFSVGRTNVHDEELSVLPYCHEWPISKVDENSPLQIAFTIVELLSKFLQASSGYWVARSNYFSALVLILVKRNRGGSSRDGQIFT
ncbi:hypothetical protein NPIL_433131 [Nephila pilipes]|uniref:Uncharacterized protein n=1 Tax=Nephila pilipes TaxID=299642 RepID=A0A8X6N0D8_NEPPI|nr:hypothetical protein NPIL_433131 [Nephila pilipes]